jgi:hypothetical protein
VIVCGERQGSKAHLDLRDTPKIQAPTSEECMIEKKDKLILELTKRRYDVELSSLKKIDDKIPISICLYSIEYYDYDVSRFIVYNCTREAGEGKHHCKFHDMESAQKYADELSKEFNDTIVTCTSDVRNHQNAGKYWLATQLDHSRFKFIGYHFYFDVNLEWKRFYARVSFAHATFHNEANFSNTIFDKQANFAFSAFNSEADFNSATFKDQANFSCAEFCKDAIFKNSKFNSKAHFDGSYCADKTGYS